MHENGNGNSNGKRSGDGAPPITCAREYFECLTEVLRRLPHAAIDEISNRLLQAYEDGRKIFLFGNGGSAALSSHIACDLGKGTTAGAGQRKRFRVVALTDNVPLMTAWANDSSYEDIFAEQLRNLIEPEDIAFAISASGNSANVLKALETTHQMGGIGIGLTGFSGGKMKRICDVCLVVPSDNMQLIEDVHLSIAHSLFTRIRHTLGQNPSHIHQGLVTTSDLQVSGGRQYPRVRR